MTWKYADDLGRYNNCPPENAVPHCREAYRFVHEDIGDHRNFKPCSKLKPRRALSAHDPCVSFALSLYLTKEQAAARYEFLREEHPNFPKTAGTHLARGILCDEDGRACHFSSNGHFSFFESPSANLAAKFTIVEALSS